MFQPWRIERADISLAAGDFELAAFQMIFKRLEI
jgi:hypothetical protein